MLKHHQPNAVLGLVVLLIFALAFRAQAAADDIWQPARVPPAPQTPALREIHPNKYRTFNLNHAALHARLGHVPRESGSAGKGSTNELIIPMPDGSLARFRILESPVMAPELAAKFPNLKTYVGHGIDDPAASLRFDLTPAGFHGQVLSPQGAVYVDPYARGETNLYLTYYKRDYQRTTSGFQCLTPETGTPIPMPQDATPLVSGTHLRTYRLACAADSEYVAFQSAPDPPNVPAGMAAIVTAVNRVTGIYETELAIRLVLVANNDQLVFTNADADPYTNNNASLMLNQNQTTIDTVIGDANYDVGHVFGTGVGGIASLGVACVSGQKARGVSGLPAPISDAFFVDYVAHELGHEFGAHHPFNSTIGSCGGVNRFATTAFEPGSGSTIMAYAGICGSDNLQPHSDPYFHSISLEEIIAYTTAGAGTNCAVVTSTGNTPPNVSAGPTHVIPSGTPFLLTGTGNDLDGNMLSFCWEERDLGPPQVLTDPDNGTSPLFRSFNPVNSSSRMFPKLSDILNSTNTPGEKLPTTSRTLNFRVTARDNQMGGGGVNMADTQVTVDSASGPFIVTSPAAGTMWSGVQTVTWNVAGSDGSPVNASMVNILLSTNGGITFPITLAANTPNDGSEDLLLPDISTTQARIKVEAADNIFFDISHGDFTITSSGPVPFVVWAGASLAHETCYPTNNAIDPNETVTINVALKNIGTADTTNLVVTLLSTNGVLFPDGPQNFGVVQAGSNSVVRPFTFMADGNCGDTITAMFQLQDGSADLGGLSTTFSLGTSVTNIQSFTNQTQIIIPDTGTEGPASPYPSDIYITGMTGLVTGVTVTLQGLSHWRVADVEVLLVGPGGQTVLLMSNAGGTNGVNGVDLTFDDATAAQLPLFSQIVSGTYQPTSGGSNTFDMPAPNPPYGATLSTFNGLDPNGDWFLYVYDDTTKKSGSLDQGWSLNLATSNIVCSVCGQSTNTTPVITDISVSGGAVTLAWTSITGRLYRVQANTDLTGSWVDLPGDVIANGSSATMTDSSGLATQRFYRVILLP
jgi:subtilisin-like proprotein convertase family protein